MKKIATVVGARPQFIKAAALSRALQGNEKLQEILIHTGQHYDHEMSDIFFEELQIPVPRYNLGISNLNHGAMTGRMLIQLEEVLTKENPDLVVVYGDTNSTVAGAMAAAKLHIPVVHIEAGLRSFNKKMPEEINRVLTDHLSTLLMCPTTASINNLRNEGIISGVHHTGDLMFDSTLFAIDAIKKKEHVKDSNFMMPFALLTVHRAESTSNANMIQQILHYVSTFAKEHELYVIFPVHPRTKKIILDQKIQLQSNIKMIDPLSYFATQAYLSKAQFLLTDSGGLQKEAYFHRVPCITLRSETEWIETIEAGWNTLWSSPKENYKERKEIGEYGKGNSANVIKQLIEEYFN